MQNIRKTSSLALGIVALFLAGAGLLLTEVKVISIGYLFVTICFCIYTDQVLKSRELEVQAPNWSAIFLALYASFYALILFLFEAMAGEIFSLKSSAINNFLSFVLAAYAEELLLRECFSRYLITKGVKVANLLWISPILFVLIHFDLNPSHFTTGLIYLIVFILTLSVRATIFCHITWNLCLAFFKCPEWSIYCRSVEKVWMDHLISDENFTRVFLISLLIVCALLYKRNESKFNDKFVRFLTASR